MNENNHGGNLKHYSDKYHISQNLLLDFSANINPLGPSEEVLKIIADNLQKIEHYPEPDSLSLLEVASKVTKVNKENIIFGNGAAELLFLLTNYLKPKKAYIPTPSFSEYELASRTAGAEIKYFKLLNNYQNFDEGFLESLEEGDLVFLCNPNNPTGTLFTKEKIDLLITYVNNKNAFLILDESFVDFLQEEKLFSYKNKTKRGNNLFVLYSLTKIHSIPGLRLGMLFGDPDVISQLYKRKDPWNVNTLAQFAGEFLLTDNEFILKSKKYFKRETEKFLENLENIKHIKIYPPSVNFIFIEILNNATVEELQKFLISKNIIIRNCSNYPDLSNKFFRIAIKKTEENDFLYKMLIEFFND